MAFQQHSPDHPLAPPPRARASRAADGTPGYIGYVVNRCELLLKHGVTPLLVIDGASLPSKALTDADRRAERRKNFETALALSEQNPPPAQSAINKAFARSLAVTHEMRQELVSRLHRLKLLFQVAPYEADAQLAFLSRACLVDAVVTEDGDALAYGCSRVLFKLDSAGNCEEVLHQVSKGNEGGRASERQRGRSWFDYDISKKCAAFLSCVPRVCLATGSMGKPQIDQKSANCEA